ncbi:hypothetical protein [Caulobacter sp. RHG1]|uniref:hypothetical protein n=1 Tax=Caulobacter sp. (strain RHG1) TaxID=2545762 RepID=UPI001555492D|nr:hypothetical protein [Caulobacter sp. RHG1]NQE61406.1 hypothetical protein [Caulobacter sp. RHG1]
MYSAIYYPHMTIESESLLRTALLTWDHLDIISPDPRFARRNFREDLAEAVEVLVRFRRPSSAELEEVHVLIEDLVTRGLPDAFRLPRDPDPDEDYFLESEMYGIRVEKFMRNTWRLLFEADLATGERDGWHHTHRHLGLLMMSMLADVMAGKAHARVTDRTRAYSTLIKLLGPHTGEALTADHLQIVPLTFKTLALEHVPIERLVDFRKREAREGGAARRALRHNYLDQINAHLKVAVEHPHGSADRREVDRVFEQRMEDDLADLKSELGLARREAFLTKEVVGLVAIGIGAVGAAVTGVSAPVPEVLGASGASIALGGILSAQTKLATARRTVLRRHPMAYLYEIDRAR